MNLYQYRCCVCGRFCVPADSSMPFDCSAYEPPDEEYYCSGCAQEQEDYYVSQGWVPNSCNKADWERRVAHRLGLVEAKMPGNAWSVWTKPDALPNGYVVIPSDGCAR